MNICEIAFSTDWFLTIPGILITCGVILLIIALIMLLVSSTKGKKNNSSSQQASVETLNVANPIAPIGMGVGVTPVSDPDLNVNATNLNVETNLNMDIPTITPTIENTLNSVAPTLESTNSVSLNTSTDRNGFTSIPTLEPIAEREIPTVETQPVITLKEDEEDKLTLGSLSSVPSVEESTVSSTVDSVSIPSVSQTENMNAFDALSSTENTNVYGGAPVIPELKPVQEEEPRPIYGGANPLESTQNIPTVEEHHEPYGGALNTIEVPVENNPVVESIPVVETVSNENEGTNIVSETVVEPTVVSVADENVAVLDTPVKEEVAMPDVPVVDEKSSTADPIVEVSETAEPVKTFIPRIDDPSTEVEEL